MKLRTENESLKHSSPVCYVSFNMRGILADSSAHMGVTMKEANSHQALTPQSVFAFIL